MGALYKKEILGFLGNLTGWIVIAVFLTVTGLFLWVLPGQMNVLENGYANLYGLFSLAPFVFLFLVPAVTMNSIAEEQRSGTIELLLVRPVSDSRIITAKFFAAFTLVVFALLPTLIYYFSVWQLGFPKGDIDSGGFWGSFIGLLFLGAAFTTTGIFASALSRNPVIAFLTAVVISAFMYMGFDFIAPFFGRNALFIQQLGISAHYASMSRGVIDTRDVIYFLSLDILFLYSSIYLLGRRKWK
ncbi:gliding motility-associated ABC transporter permease subunit GldF [Candidatus Sulfidibacterium hydrothermale]|uniref:gliding motility-associated ABC transporter permease subunit GldF n=1 Tax=Candidatus Sulfidibacterium hydrothermale TaxID=2875962 RepID=UPI001F0AD1B5|nr:gliding motility-associated ABC transporter permease subunit GldF [Candidatus Sulfidibacterium hydrothermale]UBM63255.1 gliding motility-associated ABC transporter permease subunit GldF [Candidatus Sulfidibacterium hydrothermale]